MRWFRMARALRGGGGGGGGLARDEGASKHLNVMSASGSER